MNPNLKTMQSYINPKCAACSLLEKEIANLIEKLQQQNTMPFIETIDAVRIINNRRYIRIDEFLGVTNDE